MNSVFHPLAERDLNDAAEYFEQESPGLGAAFLNEVERSIADIEAFPQSGHEVFEAADPSTRRLFRDFIAAALSRRG